MNTRYSPFHGRNLVTAHNDASPTLLNIKHTISAQSFTVEGAIRHSNQRRQRQEKEQLESQKRINAVVEAIHQKMEASGLSRNEAYLALQVERPDMFPKAKE